MTTNSALDQQLGETNVTLGILKEHLRMTQQRMKKFAD